MKIAKFSKNYREITVEGLPGKDWTHFLTNERYCALILHDGRGLSFFEHPYLSAITKWFPKSKCFIGRFIYIKDGETNRSWCLNMPDKFKFERWRIRFGIGYMTIETLKDDIHASVTYFVPPDKNLEYWMVKIKNLSKRRRVLQVFSAVELSLGKIQPVIMDGYSCELFNRTWIKEMVLYATRTTWDKVVFFSAEPEPVSFDCLKESFIGYGSLQRPQAVDEDACGDSISLGRESVFAFHHEIELADSMEEKNVTIAFGVADDKIDPKAMPSTAEDEFKRTEKFWSDEIINKGIKISTPDDDINGFVNIWNKYQNRICFLWHRYPASNYVFGFEMVGFRDAIQSIIGILPINPEACREKILYLLRFQFKNGNTCHNFNPGNDSAEPSEQVDDPLWLTIAIFEYLKETGDFEFLKRGIRYFDSDDSEPIYTHIKRAIDYVFELKGEHGLVLMKRGDWNDAMNMIGVKGRGESALASMMLVYVMNEWIKLNRFLNKDISDYEDKIKILKHAINKHCWDGRWFIRAISDDGSRIGSQHSVQGKIYLNPQTWAVISQVSDEEKLKLALESVIQFLDTRYGLLLLDPAYTIPNDRIGVITRFIAGEKENGSIFMHANAWAIIAFAIMGNIPEFRGKAFEIYRKTLPFNLAADERYKAESFVYPEYVCGKDSPHVGEGAFTWLTGSAPWMFKAFVEYILGVRAVYNGLEIKPAIPDSWRMVKIFRRFRNSDYEITIRRTGLKKIAVDGQNIDGNIVPAFMDETRHKVDVEIP
jgi:cellobiose phosphorylase